MLEREPRRVQELPARARAAPRCRIRGRRRPGWPIASRWARIWCVRPVSSVTRSSVSSGSARSVSKWVTAWCGSSVSVEIRVRTRRSRPSGASIVPRRAGGRPSTSARYSRVICARAQCGLQRGVGAPRRAPAAAGPTCRGRAGARRPGARGPARRRRAPRAPGRACPARARGRDGRRRPAACRSRTGARPRRRSGTRRRRDVGARRGLGRARSATRSPPGQHVALGLRARRRRARARRRSAAAALVRVPAASARKTSSRSPAASSGTRSSLT